MKKLEKSYAEEKQIVTSIELPSYEKEKEQIETRQESLLEALLDKVISREQFQEKDQKLRNRLEEVKQKIAELKMKEEEKPISLNDRKSSLEKIQKTLERYIDIEKEEVDFNIVTKFVSRVVPHEDDRFCWYLNLGDVTGEKNHTEFDEENYILYDSFTISFEEAKEYKKSFGKYIRKNQWEDMQIEVYVKV